MDSQLRAGDPAEIERLRKQIDALTASERAATAELLRLREELDQRETSLRQSERRQDQLLREVEVAEKRFAREYRAREMAEFRVAWKEALERRDLIAPPRRRWFGRKAPPTLQKIRKAEYAAIAASGLFDADYYAQFAPREADPIAHYIDEGARQGFDPHPLFDTRFYVTTEPKCLGRYLTPLGHFLARGQDKGGRPHPLFHTDWYVERYPEVRQGKQPPLEHFLKTGGFAGFDPNPLFDNAWYRREYAAAIPAGVNPLIHYVTAGAQAGLMPNPRFAEEYSREVMRIARLLDVDPLRLAFVEKGRTHIMRQRAQIDEQPDRSMSKEVVEELQAKYRAEGLATMPDTFILWRIIGNDLPPRHRSGQSLANLKFILDNEPELAHCDKRFVVNRIVDRESEAAVIAALERAGRKYLRIPFDEGEYRGVGWKLEGFPEPGFLYGRRLANLRPEAQARAVDTTYHFKNLYIMNNNGARNAALRASRGEAKWILPWDGNCFVTEGAWAEVIRAVLAQPYLKYFVVPMARALSNDDLVSPDFIPDPVEEPQILFRFDADEEFNEDVRYGRRPKVELLLRLGVPGVWENWIYDPWEEKTWRPSNESGQFSHAGWVARLFSGVKELELNSEDSYKNRGTARTDAIKLMIDGVDESLARRTFRSDRLMVLDEARLESNRAAFATDEALVRPVVQHLLKSAGEALKRGPYSVVQKTTLPPSGDRHDYWHPAPYWWPNPDAADGLPYVKRDTKRVPGTEPYGPGSEKYDRTRLQMMFDDTLTLALATWFSGRDDFAAHAAELVRTWFLAPRTRMNPHMIYSQVRMGHQNNKGAGTGIIEMRDLYYFLDGVRLLIRQGAFNREDEAAFKEWLGSYLKWLQESRPGVAERARANNHGTVYDLQVAVIAAFLDDLRLALDTLKNSRQRIAQQFEPDGAQPEEITRPTSKHYCAFNLECWMNLAVVAQSCGVDLWHHTSSDGRSLRRGMEWFLTKLDGPWPYEEAGEFNLGRALPLRLHGLRAYGAVPAGRPPSEAEIWAANPVFGVSYGIRPYWMLG